MASIAERLYQYAGPGKTILVPSSLVVSMGLCPLTFLTWCIRPEFQQGRVYYVLNTRQMESRHAPAAVKLGAIVDLQQ